MTHRPSHKSAAPLDAMPAATAAPKPAQYVTTTRGAGPRDGGVVPPPAGRPITSVLRLLTHASRAAQTSRSSRNIPAGLADSASPVGSASQVGSGSPAGSVGGTGRRGLGTPERGVVPRAREHRTRRRPARTHSGVLRLGVVGSLALALAACSSGGSDVGAPPARSGAAASAPFTPYGPSAGPLLPQLLAPLSQAEAAQVSDAYDDVNNRANARMDAAVLASIETESALRIDIAGYRIYAREKAPTSPGGPLAPFGTTSRKYVIPKLPAGEPQWWVMVGRQRPTQSSDDVMHLFVRDKTRGAWKVARLSHAPAGWMPPLAMREGNAVAVSAAELNRAPATPQRITEAIGAAVAATGARGTVAVANTPALQQLRQEFEVGRGVLARSTVSAAPPVYGLRTADGGTLMVLRMQVGRALSVPGGTLVVKNADAAAWVGDRERPSLSEVREYNLTVYAPPRGPVRLLASYGGLVEAH
jgi:hypothetical protein